MAILTLSVTAPGAIEDLAVIADLASTGRYEAALEELEQYLSAHAEDGEAKLLQGVLLADSGDREAAKNVFGSLVRAYPDSPVALNNLAVLLAAEDDSSRAIDALEEAISRPTGRR